MNPEWASLVAGRAFITDLGFQPPGTVTTEAGAQVLGRYAAWLPFPQQNRHFIVEVSAKLRYLQAKYDVPDSLVFRFQEPPDQAH